MPSRRHLILARLLIFAAFLLAVVAFYWLLTYGTWRIFEQETLGSYYDSLADSMLHGRLDVSRGSIGSEAFLHNGRYYGYFGPTPALPRVVLNILYPGLFGQWSRLSLMAAYLLSLWLVFRLVKKLIGPAYAPDSSRWRATIVPLLILAAGCGSPMMFLASRSLVFHEAILWGSALAMACGYGLFLYVRGGESKYLYAAAAAAMLSFFARPTTGAGALLALSCTSLLACLDWLGRDGNRRPFERIRRFFRAVPADHPGRDALLAFGCCLLASVTYFAMNRIKFGTWNGLPLNEYVQYQKEPRRLQITGGRQMHLSNLRTGLVAYFGRLGVVPQKSFPWFGLERQARVFPEAHIDVNDWCSSVPGSMPALCLLACIGCWELGRGRFDSARQLRLPVIALAAGGAIVFFTVGICQRYVQDFYPALVFAAALGAARLATLRLRRPSGVMVAVCLGVFVALSCAIEMAFGLQYQRTSWGISEEKRVEFRTWQNRIDSALGVASNPRSIPDGIRR